MLVGLVSADVWAMEGMDPRSGTTTQDFEKGGMYDFSDEKKYQQFKDDRGITSSPSLEKIITFNTKGDYLDKILESKGLDKSTGILDRMKATNEKPMYTLESNVEYKKTFDELKNLKFGDIKFSEYLMETASANRYYEIGLEIKDVHKAIVGEYQNNSNKINEADNAAILSSLESPTSIKIEDYKDSVGDRGIDGIKTSVSGTARMAWTSIKAGVVVPKYLPAVKAAKVALNEGTTVYNLIKVTNTIVDAPETVGNLLDIASLAFDVAELLPKVYEAISDGKDIPAKLMLDISSNMGKISFKLAELNKVKTGGGDTANVLGNIGTLLGSVDAVVTSNDNVNSLKKLNDMKVLGGDGYKKMELYSQIEVAENTAEAISALMNALGMLGVPAAKNTGDIVGDLKTAAQALTTPKKITIETELRNEFKKAQYNNRYSKAVVNSYIAAYSKIDLALSSISATNLILPSAPREPDPSFIHQITLGSLPSNSDIGSPKNYMVNNTDFIGMKDIASGFKETLIAANGSSEKNTNTNPVQSGQQQSTFLNTQPFSSTDWIVKEGASNNFVKTESFGSVIAPNNKPMAALNNANASHTVMERTFTIPTGVKNVSLGFNANFITNEFPAFVGSQFNDNVKVEIVTASGNLYEINNPIPFKESLNASQLTPVTGLPSPMQPDGGQTGFKPIDVTNIPVAGGGAVTVRVTVENTGDQLYPSAALISDTQAKPR